MDQSFGLRFAFVLLAITWVSLEEHYITTESYNQLEGTKNNGTVNGGFTNWSSYGECSKTCGRGSSTRIRTCTNPAPKHEGKPCVGPTKQTKHCNVQPCLGLVSCSTHCTPFQTDGNDKPVYFDRHTLHCPKGKVMNQMILHRNPNHTQIQFQYRCCTSRLPCIDSQRRNGQTFNGGGQGNTVYLDQQNIRCTVGQAMSSLKLDRKELQWNYIYDCCKVVYKDATFTCKDYNTGFNNDGGGKSVYLDRHDVKCPKSDQFLHAMKLNRNPKPYGKYRYDYECCSIDVPKPSP